MIANRIKQVLNNNIASKILGQKINNKWEWTTRKQLNNKINFCIEKLKDSNINKNDRVIYKGKNSVQGGNCVIASYFGGTNIIYAKKGNELLCNSYNGHYKKYFNCNVLHSNNYKDFIKLIKSNY